MPKQSWVRNISEGIRGIYFFIQLLDFFQLVFGDIKPGLPHKNFRAEISLCHNMMMNQWQEQNHLHHSQHQMFHNLILLVLINLSYDPLILPIDHFAYTLNASLRRCHYQPPVHHLPSILNTHFQSGRSRFFRDLTCNKTRTCNFKFFFYLSLHFAFDLVSLILYQSL